MIMAKLLHALAVSVALAGAAIASEPVVQPPPALTLDAVPQVPVALRAATQPYMEFRTASFQGWDPKGSGIIIATRFGNAAQVHRVAAPGAMREQLTFEPEPVAGGSYAPRVGDLLLVGKDVGGDENFQFYRVKSGRLDLLTDGRSRNTSPTWSHDGRLIGFSSNARNGRDSDLWVMDPRQPGSKRMVAEREGGGWSFADFAPDGKTAVIRQYVSVTDSRLFRLDLETGAMTPLTRNETPVAYGRVRHAPDGRIFVTADAEGEFRELGTLDPATGAFARLGAAARWDVDNFDISPDGSRIAAVSNEAGASVLRIIDAKDGRVIAEPRLGAGLIGGLEWSPRSTLGFTFSGNRSPGDAFEYVPETGEIIRWTRSETGGLDPARNVEPELVRVKSFDGLEVTGFLYRPDPKRHPGPRPVIVSIHGGPEAQFRPGFLGRTNFLINELGVAIFYPNVRGSTGFGKTFVSLDNGPWLRENSVKDIEALTKALKRDRGLDPKRFGVTGGSYGGYMTYASFTLFPDLWRAGLSVVGISDFITFLENTAGYRQDLRRVEYGDERDPKQRAKLKEISPLGRADRIRVPLKVVTGTNDPRVPASEADQMVEAVRRNGGEAWHLLAANEGHGFARKENADYQFWTSLMFWQRHLLN
jgi:dipeptidyl aminopeptidase/acylaminoacyl peptidase